MRIYNINPYLCKMNTKDYLITWWWNSILMFLLYDIVWILADHEDFSFLLKEDSTVLWIDFCYCFLFSSYNLVFGTILLKSRLLKIFGNKKVLIFCTTFLFANTVLAFIIENMIDLIWIEIPMHEAWGNAYLIGLISCVQALIVAVEYYCRKLERKYEENRMLEMQLLKMQLNPHFIFNSLSVLTGLIRIDATRAENYVVRLSRIYRHILGHIEIDIVLLEDAFRFLEDYTALLQLRYTNIELIIHDIDCSDNPYILSQSLQVVIENAVKHNSLNRSTKLTITINREKDMLTITNNIIASDYNKNSSNPSHKIGLKNLSQRYLIKFNKKIKIQTSANEFKVYLPIIHLNKHEESFDYRR